VTAWGPEKHQVAICESGILHAKQPTVESQGALDVCDDQMRVKNTFAANHSPLRSQV